MRPVAVVDGLPGRSRKSSLADPQLPTDLRNAGPTTYFLAREDELEDSTLKSSEEQKDNSYGVRSLEETIGGMLDIGKGRDETAPGDYESSSPRRRSTITPVDRQDSPSVSSKHISRTNSVHRPSPNMPASQPLTPLFIGSPPDGSSLPSSPKSTSTRSFKQLDEESGFDETGSQAITSGGEDEVEVPSEIQDSAPQLIMPSIKMPSRRPFTQRGKNMGRFKVLIAGETGMGKTSLIKSIVQLCEDIVHVDPLSPNYPKIEVPQPKRQKGKASSREVNSTHAITEIYASTRPYPSWWSDFEESKILRRRKSMGDSVLERNLCFVDCPGCRQQSGSDGLEPTIRYMESQLQRAYSAVNTGDSDLVNLLSGNGGSQVDAVFYLISETDTLPSDITNIERLSALANVIPIISKADLLSPQQIQTLKEEIHTKTHQASVRWFWLAKPDEEPKEPDIASPDGIFAVSSANSDDIENMDASLLMSPDYVQPLASSDLGVLVQRLFEQDTVSWLRHSTAKKLVQWRNSHPPSLKYMSQGEARSPFSLRSASASGFASPLSSASTSQVLVSYSGDNSTYTLARIADHTQREEKLAQMRLANWATDLQRSLQNERERYEALARAERAIWLTERLSECVIDGNLVPINRTPGVAVEMHETGSAGTLIKAGQRYTPYYGTTTIDRHDPLGLLQWNEKVKHRGWMAIQIIGSFGVIGGLALWFAKSWGQGLQEWDWEHWGWQFGR